MTDLSSKSAFSSVLKSYEALRFLSSLSSFLTVRLQGSKHIMIPRHLTVGIRKLWSSFHLLNVQLSTVTGVQYKLTARTPWVLLICKADVLGSLTPQWKLHHTTYMHNEQKQHLNHIPGAFTGVNISNSLVRCSYCLIIRWFPGPKLTLLDKISH